MVAIESMANSEGRMPSVVRPMVMCAPMTSRLHERKTGLRGNQFRQMAAKRPPGIFARETMKFM